MFNDSRVIWWVLSLGVGRSHSSPVQGKVAGNVAFAPVYVYEPLPLFLCEARTLAQSTTAG